MQGCCIPPQIMSPTWACLHRFRFVLNPKKSKPPYSLKRVQPHQGSTMPRTTLTPCHTARLHVAHLRSTGLSR